MMMMTMMRVDVVVVFGVVYRLILIDYVFIVCPMQCNSIGQSIKSPERSSMRGCVRPSNL